jgi:hypothetical protein
LGHHPGKWLPIGASASSFARDGMPNLQLAALKKLAELPHEALREKVWGLKA